jgi:hypothetical protein
MRVLVATNDEQGTHEGDYSWTLEGELVLTGPLLECCEPVTCGCGRGFPGLGSGRATTTAVVVERPELDPADLQRAIHDSLERQGWLEGLATEEADVLVEMEAALIRRAATAFRVGAVLSRDGDHVWQRGREAA